MVSVIIIFWNAAKFLQEAIDSVYAQTYTNWELLLVDDGATDASPEIARRCAAQEPERVRYFAHLGHQNRGMSASRNLGIRHAQGEYMAFLDADDVWLPHILEEQVAILTSHPLAAMVYGPIQFWYSWTRNPEDKQRDFTPKLPVQPNILLKPPMLLILLLQNRGQNPAGFLVRHEIVKEVGGFEEAFPSLYEDQVFWTKICLKAPVFVSGQCWYKYRQHPESSCALATTAQVYRARSAFLNWFQGHLSVQGAKGTKLWHVLQRELWLHRHPVLQYLLKRSWQPVEIRELLKHVARRALPARVYQWLKSRWRGDEYCPLVGRVRFGSLRRIKPINHNWGFDRGLPIDRYYIERFLSVHASDVRGRVLEIGVRTYTHRFGGDRVCRSDVLHVAAGESKATVVADLTCADHVPSDSFDCIILTQTLQFIYDVRAALQTLFRIMKPGGVLLATFPGISQISRYDMERWGDYWRFTSRSSRRLFEEVFPSEQICMETYGNVLTAMAFLHGLAAEEVRQGELDSHDPDYEVVIAVRAVKPREV
jgi:glycosyltransferase involved in cell wall biosynthesis